MMDEDEMQAFCSNIAKISGDWYRLYKAAPPQEEEGPHKQHIFKPDRPTSTS